MKLSKLTLILSFLAITPALSAGLDRYCTIKQETEKSIFYCLDQKTKNMYSREVDPITEYAYEKDLTDNAYAVFISLEEFAVRAYNLTNRIIPALGSSDELVCYQKAGYTFNELNRFSDDHPAMKSLKELATILKNNGVCELPVPTNLSHLKIYNSDDVLTHFLCITNSESVFGTQNIGIGGRGPFGINPMHTKPGGLCYPSRAIVRNNNGQEVKDNESYVSNHKVRVDNAICAMKLFLQENKKGRIKGFMDWGQDSTWGSNRHCTPKIRTRLNFAKQIGELGCCTDACKKRITKGQEI